MARELPNKKNLIVLDLATGTGDVALHLAKEPRIKKITGLDLSKKMIEIGKEKVLKKNYQNIATTLYLIVIIIDVFAISFQYRYLMIYFCLYN